MRRYFQGWYFKCQSDSQTLAVIPAIHRAGFRRTCSIQLITPGASWSVSFPHSALQNRRKGLSIGQNRFSEQGFRLQLSAPGLTAEGRVRFGPFTPLPYDIMGPFRRIPFLECRHSVWSMAHTVNGSLCINGEIYRFRNGAGYMEGDRGRSFPRNYLWTQCALPEGSLMLSVARVPLAGFAITGIIGVILWQGRQYRLATYLGARVTAMEKGQVVISQGRMQLTASLLENAAHPLQAPERGAMVRTIREHPACRASYRFQVEERVLFALTLENASFEYEYPI